MKTIKNLLVLLFFSAVATATAQNVSGRTEVKVSNNQDKMAYYKQRGSEDARFEMAFKAKTKAEDKAFWNEQKEYEKNLKRQNRKAYRVYIASKQEAYAEHHHRCDAHCYHSDSFYHHAGYYYYGYEPTNYQSRPSSTTVNTQIGVRAPSVRLGVF